MRWRLELSSYSFNIVYRPGKVNIPSETLSRASCAVTSEDSLHKLHVSLCHTGITRLYHFVRSKNLPYSLEEIKRVLRRCLVCYEHKPKYHLPEKVHLIKAIQPFERINIDFKGPLPSSNGNHYLLISSMSIQGSLYIPLPRCLNKYSHQVPNFAFLSFWNARIHALRSGRIIHE